MQLPSGRSGASGSDLKRGVVQSWLPEATKLDADWQLGGHWQPSNTRQNRPKVRQTIYLKFEFPDMMPACGARHGHSCIKHASVRSSSNKQADCSQASWPRKPLAAAIARPKHDCTIVQL